MTATLALIRCKRGATAAEFALVLPVFLIMLFGIIDGGRFLWEFNEAEKAAQVGARVAIVTNVLSSGLHDEAYAGQTVAGTKIASGARIPSGALGTVKCTSTSCTCEVAPCPASLGTLDTTTFNDVLVARMQQIDPRIQASNVVVRYSGSGLGFAGNVGSSATGEMEISPLITVSLTGLQFTPLTSYLFVTVTMPDFATTLPAEDASGQYSN